MIQLAIACLARTIKNNTSVCSSNCSKLQYQGPRGARPRLPEPQPRARRVEAWAVHTTTIFLRPKRGSSLEDPYCFGQAMPHKKGPPRRTESSREDPSGRKNITRARVIDNMV